MTKLTQLETLIKKSVLNHFSVYEIEQNLNGYSLNDWILDYFEDAQWPGSYTELNQMCIDFIIETCLLPYTK